jgi:DNA-binding response OmpR family regulator
MKTIDNIAVFDNDECFFALLKGYCYANHIALTKLDLNLNGINELETLKPALIVVPLNLLSVANKNFEIGLLKQTCTKIQTKICALNTNSTDIFSVVLLGWIDVVINNPFDIKEFDGYCKKTFVFNSCLIRDRRRNERRNSKDRRNIDNNIDCDNGSGETVNPCSLLEAGNTGFKDFKIDQRNKCVILEGHKVDLTPKEFELIELLLTDIDRIFTTEEIIKHLWPENHRATKSDLYQYMHLLRKKLEKDPNNPEWILNVKGFGYKLNITLPESVHEEAALYQVY